MRIKSDYFSCFLHHTSYTPPLIPVQLPVYEIWNSQPKWNNQTICSRAIYVFIYALPPTCMPEIKLIVRMCVYLPCMHPIQKGTTAEAQLQTSAVCVVCDVADEFWSTANSDGAPLPAAFLGSARNTIDDLVLCVGIGLPACLSVQRFNYLAPKRRKRRGLMGPGPTGQTTRSWMQILEICNFLFVTYANIITVA